MKVYVGKDFARNARRQGLTDKDLRAAIVRAEKGSIDADLGHGLIKQRVPRENEGRSGGYRTIIFYKKGRISVFLHMFAKSGQANLKASELQVYVQLAKGYEKLTAAQIKELIKSGRWKEIEYEKDETDLS